MQLRGLLPSEFDYIDDIEPSTDISPGVAIGIAIGVFVLIVSLIVLIYCLCIGGCVFCCKRGMDYAEQREKNKQSTHVVIKDGETSPVTYPQQGS
ncbi:MAG: uncharacterized protein KVP18_003922 [Porospora cf. gigantea A]|uniref:uncharacterized protein n=1 Tax=Porospora cf. gigantea A TaxID=2853593 RepID=UPI00355A13F3|nr:MAG: hypothetical protein KVP18_003922 [Porospora cf. gigantea A]